MILTTCCCCSIVAILIANSNSAIDDNFEIRLNGNILGTINNNFSTCTGRIFSSDTGVNSGNLTGIGSCDSGIYAFEATVNLDTSLFVTGTNTLEIYVTQNNHNGNFGKVKVLGLNLDGSNYSICKTYELTSGGITGNYNFLSIDSGVGQAFTFSYP